MAPRREMARLIELVGSGDADFDAGPMLTVLRTVVPESDAVYVSAPITSGRRVLDHHREGRSFDRTEIVNENIHSARDMVDRTRRQYPDKVVIDPTALDDQPGWEQHHYHRFWLSVIDEFVAVLVASDQWQYSTGCTLEVLHALDSGLEVLDSDFNAIGASGVRDLLAAAISDFDSVGMVRPYAPEIERVASCLARSESRGFLRPGVR